MTSTSGSQQRSRPVSTAAILTHDRVDGDVEPVVGVELPGEGEAELGRVAETRDVHGSAGGQQGRGSGLGLLVHTEAGVVDRRYEQDPTPAPT